ncbi:hypothetical protein P280DRAFT_517960 [Massarina eburnea CBS 473.64]|uniref:Uncharacterized protein n=1 Tax=Massarina eburnea CBS 473.64 TaxID=1395130 RepID=A0A6A6S078_9PLEO|nr:hypothetical protein P280DRAFT_517960 [Massarina eburnea CBS 473.64]
MSRHDQEHHLPPLTTIPSSPKHPPSTSPSLRISNTATSRQYFSNLSSAIRPHDTSPSIERGAFSQSPHTSPHLLVTGTGSGTALLSTSHQNDFSHASNNTNHPREQPSPEGQDDMFGNRIKDTRAEPLHVQMKRRPSYRNPLDAQRDMEQDSVYKDDGGRKQKRRRHSPKRYDEDQDKAVVSKRGGIGESFTSLRSGRMIRDLISSDEDDGSPTESSTPDTPSYRSASSSPGEEDEATAALDLWELPITIHDDTEDTSHREGFVDSDMEALRELSDGLADGSEGMYPSPYMVEKEETKAHKKRLSTIDERSETGSSGKSTEIARDRPISIGSDEGSPFLTSIGEDSPILADARVVRIQSVTVGSPVLAVPRPPYKGMRKEKEKRQNKPTPLSQTHTESPATSPPHPKTSSHRPTTPQRTPSPPIPIQAPQPIQPPTAISIRPLPSQSPSPGPETHQTIRSNINRLAASTPTPSRSMRTRARPRKPLGLNQCTPTIYHLTHSLQAKQLFHTTHKKDDRRFSIHSGVKNSPAYCKAISEGILRYYCGETEVQSLIDRFCRRQGEKEVHLVIVEEIAKKTAVQRLMRYMRRSCGIPVLCPVYEFTAPGTGIREGIDTLRALEVFGLAADYSRIRALLIKQILSGRRLTFDDVESVWYGYGAVFRETEIGDAVVCWILFEGMGRVEADKTKVGPMDEEIMMVLNARGYEGLRGVVMREVGRKAYRNEYKASFMERRRWERTMKKKMDEESRVKRKDDGGGGSGTGEVKRMGGLELEKVGEDTDWDLTWDVQRDRYGTKKRIREEDFAMSFLTGDVDEVLAQTGGDRHTEDSMKPRKPTLSLKKEYLRILNSEVGSVRSMDIWDMPDNLAPTIQPLPRGRLTSSPEMQGTHTSFSKNYMRSLEDRSTDSWHRRGLAESLNSAQKGRGVINDKDRGGSNSLRPDRRPKFDRSYPTASVTQEIPQIRRRPPFLQQREPAVAKQHQAMPRQENIRSVRRGRSPTPRKSLPVHYSHTRDIPAFSRVPSIPNPRARPLYTDPTPSLEDLMRKTDPLTGRKPGWKPRPKRLNNNRANTMKSLPPHPSPRSFRTQYQQRGGVLGSIARALRPRKGRSKSLGR